MEKITIDINDDVMDTLKKIRELGVSNLIVEVPKNSVLFENALNLKLIRKELEKSGKSVEFETEDEVGKNLIELLDPMEAAKIDEDTGFISQSRDAFKESKKPFLKIPFKFHFSKSLFLILLIFILVIVPLSYFFLKVYPKAKIRLKVNSQPLVKSETVMLSTLVSSVDAKRRLIPGRPVEATASASMEIDTTGEKTVGEKAKGEVTVVNKTTDDKKIKKGTSITLITSKEALKFVADEEVTVPKLTQEPAPSELEPAPAPVYGKKKLKVEAEVFGSKYNLEDGKNFKISGFDTDDLIATNEEEFTGGKSKKVKAVSEEDKVKLSNTLFEALKGTALLDLKSSKLSKEQKLLESTVTYRRLSEAFDKNIGEEADKLSLKLTVSARGLYYLSDELSSLLEELLKEFVRPGFQVSKRDNDTEVGVLDTIDPSKEVSEVSLQVKIKAYTIPKIDESELRAKLKGADVSYAKDYLGKIEGVGTLNVDFSPRFVAFLNKLPENEKNIEIEIERE
ncbi:hypothetical protein A2716_04805 [candidate division WWE3 bacterium RIFCSPHIGHO2_01_FULL_40_23]|uniref:Baseplate protein J-like domain-containing protein n=1 Tax=candidate division WWE3 bacterium RIFCSPLOWO2_01_FULL_41_18 TaxID=1802625 RepID=A0A1F4VE27_UNCKA|nr:MAG: hypothetical protein A2716_04805 [candidate division WWE3 bacterium RIFCSPHIGHO2_01_FULL_40_23]OGC55190.1 MAG: hypothetical protein A3A78_04415 [candidate division WWE3 bacterium RIFCSPLOWO2_01_FULL_41_18]